MKKLLIILLAFGLNAVFAQTKNYNEIETYLDVNVNTNAAQKITGAILNTALVDYLLANQPSLTYDTTRNYVSGQFAIYNNSGYVCSSSTSGAFDAGDWMKLIQNDSAWVSINVDTIKANNETKIVLTSDLDSSRIEITTTDIAFYTDKTNKMNLKEGGRLDLINPAASRLTLALGTSTARGGIGFNTGNANYSSIFDSNDGTFNNGLSIASRNGIIDMAASSSGLPSGSARLNVNRINTNIISADLANGVTGALPLKIYGSGNPNDNNDGIEIFTYDSTAAAQVKRMDFGSNTSNKITTYFETEVKAGLAVTTTTAAFIVPRMTTTQRDALSGINGMIIYNTTTNAFNFYENGIWATK